MRSALKESDLETGSMNFFGSVASRENHNMEGYPASRYFSTMIFVFLSALTFTAANLTKLFYFLRISEALANSIFII